MLAVKQEPYVRAGVVNSAINIYIALDDWERARDLLALEATTSNTPHYYIGDLADVEEHLGNKQRSVELLAEAYEKAKGPASRFQWGYQYLDGLLRLTPDDLADHREGGRCRSSPSSTGRTASTAARCRASTSSTRNCASGTPPRRAKRSSSKLRTQCRADLHEGGRRRGDRRRLPRVPRELASG